MKKKILAVFVALLMSLTPVVALADTKKDETVYINLNNDGSVKDTRVVNHVYGTTDGEYYLDYGKYTSIKNLIGKGTPIVEGEIIKWPAKMVKDNDIYYEGTTDKISPIKLDIKYFLDNKEIKAEELAGKNGHLRINLGVKYIADSKGKIPKLMAQIQLPADMGIFKNIIITGGSKTIVGSTANITFVSMPMEAQSFIVEMDGTNIELKAITISVVSAQFSLPGGISSGLNEFTDGLSKIETNMVKLEKGLGESVGGTTAFKNGLESLKTGMASLDGGCNQLYEGSRKITQGMEEFHSGLSTFATEAGKMIGGIEAVYQGLDKLYLGSQETYRGIGGLYDGAKGLNKGTLELSKGISDLKGEHDQLVALAKQMLDSPDPRVVGMAKGIIEEAKALEALNLAAVEVNKGTAQLEGGLRKTYTGLEAYNKGFAEVQQGLKQIADNTKQIPSSLEMMSNKYGALKAGTNEIFKGYTGIDGAIGELNKNISALPSSAQRLADGQSSIKAGYAKLRSEGITTMKTSINDSIGELIGSINSADAYNSFMDNANNKNSTVQFVMQTQPIEIKDVAKPVTAVEENLTFWQRVLALFKK